MPKKKAVKSKQRLRGTSKITDRSPFPPEVPVILVVGVGNMGSALVHGLLRPGAPAAEIRIADIHPEKLDRFASERRVSATSDLRKAAADASVVVLCTKPQDLPVVAAAIGKSIRPGALLLTLAAGVSMEKVSNWFHHKGPVVRAMPNLAAVVGAAATALSSNDECLQVHKDLAQAIFESFGEAMWVRESLLNAVTGLSGSGPAYIFMVIEALTDGGVKMGIPRDVASRLSIQTVFGAAAMLKELHQHPAILREQVTTPGGTTINAIHELEERGLRAMLMSAVATATNRAADLERGTASS